MTSYHVSMLYNTSVGIGFPNDDAHHNKFKIQRCAKYALIKVLQHNVQYNKYQYRHSVQKRVLTCSVCLPSCLFSLSSSSLTASILWCHSATFSAPLPSFSVAMRSCSPMCCNSRAASLSSTWWRWLFTYRLQYSYTQTKSTSIPESINTVGIAQLPWFAQFFHTKFFITRSRWSLP